MSSHIKGIDVRLHVKTPTGGADAFGRPLYSERTVTVHNVLVSPVESADIVSDVNLSGKHLSYELRIPKGDMNCWENTKVEFFGAIWDTVGYPKAFIEEMLPLDWNRIVRVERHE